VWRVVNNLDITYYIRSSALGGQVVNEMSETGGQRRTHIYANGRQVARQKNGNTYWRSVDAANLTDMESDGSGAVWSRVQLDPLGVVTATGSASPPGGTMNPVGFYGDPSNVSNGCRLDGAPFPCDWLTRIINGGSAVECPDGSCGPRAIRDEHGNATGGFEWFRAYADGYAGWLPVNAIFNGSGNGSWHYPGSDVGGRLGYLLEVGFQQRGPVDIKYLEPKREYIPQIDGILFGFLSRLNCVRAYNDLGIDIAGLLANGLTIFGSHLLTDGFHDAKSLGLNPQVYNGAKQAIDSGIDAFTVPSEYNNVKFGYEPLVTDGRPHIILNATAVTNGYNRLKNVLAHELIHAGGYAGKRPSFWDLLRGRNDLSYLGDKLKAVERYCGEAPTPVPTIKYSSQ
jgi:hypothetical protein